ncbi:MAG: porin family protein [Scytonematopsis contorta HA4267-MV1]|jgi:hypothetical protein|nr:porin family protein [Scytonematopsis contorta HA4267-MV1]
MHNIIKSAATLSAALVISCAPFISAKPASAEPQRFTRGYVGAGVGFNEGGAVPNVTGRISFGDVPLSLRGTVFFGSENDVSYTLVVPTLTYDIGLGKSANLYVGGGYAVLGASDGQTSIAVNAGGVLTAGAEAEITKNIVLYGDGTFLNGANVWKVGLGYSF